jgi:zinc and cadmium transporter
MTPTTLVFVYGSALFAMSLLGSSLPRRFQMTHTRTQMVLSLVSGLMLGVALLHLIPHSYAAVERIDSVMIWTLAGLVFMLLLLRWFHFHQHDFGGAAADCDLSSGDSHDHAHAHDHAHPPDQSLGAAGLFAGLCVHTIVDGLALGAVLVSASAGVGLAGAGVFLAILLHKPLDALSIETVMAATGSTPAARRLAGWVFALLCPLVLWLFYFGAAPYLALDLWLPATLAFSAGAFICIALGDLLPEVQFHSHDRVRLTLLFLLGIGLAMTLGWFEPAH